jgi:hypothetical protein
LNAGSYSHTFYQLTRAAGATFNPQTSTVTINDPAGGILYSSFNFYNLTITTHAPIIFVAGTTTTILNTLTITGAAADKTELRSSIAGSTYNINPQGSRNITYADVKDSVNTNATPIAAGATSTDSGNNTNWTF